MNTTILIPIATIAAALIAGSFSYLALVVSKENKISELRQKWIDELREEIAEFIASLRLMDHDRGLLARGLPSEAILKEKLTSFAQGYENCVLNTNKILLRLNPEGEKNQKSADVISELKFIQDAMSGGKMDIATANIPKLREKSQALLRAEWKRVKKGEPIFYWSKYILLVLIAGSIISGLVIGFRYSNTAENKNENSFKFEVPH